MVSRICDVNKAQNLGVQFNVNGVDEISVNGKEIVRLYDIV